MAAAADPRSVDGGAAWVAVDGAPLLQVVTWTGGGSTAVGVDPGGSLWTTTDAATSWQERCRLGFPPQAVAVAATGRGLRIAVVTAEGVLESVDGGRTFTDVPIG
ncbi:beta propeller repeat protein [Blastococcus deserti]|uniref:Uncharacterized protein n=1 Tax=Blastococcus deserti TaxID=2259033 RepID=A0ABW4XAV2_9ACTN